ncbi:MAG TPA: serine/threonine-protein kinase [Streptosporangiaceae bacterium]|nr:serine/threonine-protein kinase [Streptosporangiaceae bacterium]
MTTAAPDWLDLAYADADGRPQSALATENHQILCAGGSRLRELQLSDGSRVWQVILAEDAASGAGLTAGFERVDNEILAGLRLHRVVQRHGLSYPVQLGQLVGYEAASAQPYALLRPWRGQPASVAIRRMQPAERERFGVSLLKGLSWLAAAGISHRGISPDSVRWDYELQEVQITDFSLATVTGAPRTGIGRQPWAGPEQRPGSAAGYVSDRDDLWGAGQLIYYLHSGELLTGPADLRAQPHLARVIGNLFSEPASRPAAREVLAAINVSDPVPAQSREDPLERGRELFRLAMAGLSQAAMPAGEAGPAGVGAGEAGPPRSRQRRPRRWLPRRPAGRT